MRQKNVEVTNRAKQGKSLVFGSFTVYKGTPSGEDCLQSKTFVLYRFTRLVLLRLFYSGFVWVKSDLLRR